MTLASGPEASWQHRSLACALTVTADGQNPDLFRATAHEGAPGTTYGGNVAAQAVSAAGRAVADDRHLHSAHAYFVRRGDPTRPIVYFVTRIRDGGSFSVRQVRAEQDGNAILLLMTSFQRPETGPTRAVECELTPGPDAAAPLLSAVGPTGQIANEQILRLADVRFVDDPDQGGSGPGGPRARLWMRSRFPLGADPAVNGAALMYLSDVNLARNAIYPHLPTESKFRISSLDHAVWIHQPIKVDSWNLFVQSSAVAGHGRSLTSCRVYDIAGRLVASVAQEVLIREC